jgi:catechol 2,3-dioxygenase-like lactoylglutathione lyase family enzyme
MRVNKILETCLYVSDLDEARWFYNEILGLKVFSSEENRHVFFRCGEAMLLLFSPDETQKPGQDVPSHGARGAGHVAFAIEQKEYRLWNDHLIEKKVTLEKEIEWPDGGKSIYFRDPSGNSVELATLQTWGIKQPLD